MRHACFKLIKTSYILLFQCFRGPTTINYRQKSSQVQRLFSLFGRVCMRICLQEGWEISEKREYSLNPTFGWCTFPANNPRTGRGPLICSKTAKIIKQAFLKYGNAGQKIVYCSPNNWGIKAMYLATPLVAPSFFISEQLHRASDSGRYWLPLPLGRQDTVAVLGFLQVSYGDHCSVCFSAVLLKEAWKKQHLMHHNFLVNGQGDPDLHLDSFE